MKFNRKRQEPTPSPILQPSSEEEENNTIPPEHHDEIYDYYFNELIPALLSAFPILMHRLFLDSKAQISLWIGSAYHFFLPGWTFPQQPYQIGGGGGEALHQRIALKLAQLWERAPPSEELTAPLHQLLKNFDLNGDGEISASELVNMTELVAILQNNTQQLLKYQREIQQSAKVQTFWVWLSREWPLLDWKLGVLLWRSFGGVLLVLAVLSIVPGRLHSLSGKILRWPILLMTYLIIAVELMVYIWIRLGIRLAETLIANPNHRQLRRKMAQAESYPDWYQYAAALDLSQRRDRWQKHNDVATGYIYNWQLIEQLIKDLKEARAKKDPLLALAVLRQCTRKNIGGVMSEDLFSYTNTGEPKYIVSEFIDEVTTTLNWITDDAVDGMGDRKRANSSDTSSSSISKYNKNLHQKIVDEKDKIWKSIESWATLNFDHSKNESEDHHKTNDRRPSNGSTDTIPLSESAANSYAAAASAAANNTMTSKKRQHHVLQLQEFLKAARAAYGRTALCLSGGAAMGCYHFGHLYGLMECDALPHIISGTSAGSAIAALVCTRTNEEIKRDLNPETVASKMQFFTRPWSERFKSLWKNGHMFAYDDWHKMAQWFSSDLTFQEAYEKTGRVMCITLASTTKKASPILLNHLNAPNITIASAVVASAAVPGFVAPVRLTMKDSDGNIISAGDEEYFDGSILHDIPIAGLAEMLNCQFFIACQVNPHIVPFFFNSKGAVGQPSRWSSGEQAWSWRGGFLLAALELYLKNDMKAKFIFLNDLEAAVGFTSTMMTQQFHGSTTIVPHVQFWDYFRLFSDPDPQMIERCMQIGSVAAYQHAAMIRSHYCISDTLEDCIARLGHRDSNGVKSYKPSRRASFETNEQISNAVAHLHRPTSFDPKKMPEVISAALEMRLAESDSSSDMSEDNSL
ncbi:unnamed protein product [Cylindrotheca closterium]|uniref:Uncharacterized protein n=1 Tax=Cylindrotheca closterium TaxID=2856 RepID=A0AAD2FTK4_9STRA|nr:unnamed protein product [Cylindrotheca closterium]